MKSNPSNLHFIRLSTDSKLTTGSIYTTFVWTKFAIRIKTVDIHVLTLGVKYIIFNAMSISDFFKSLNNSLNKGKKKQPQTTTATEAEIKQEAKAPETPKIKEERFILCIDGGGMRGVIPVIYLQKLEEELQKQGSKDSLDSYFDLIAGTSTGGLIALSLTCPSSFGYKLCDNAPQVKLEELLEQYETIGPTIFPASTFTYLRKLASTKYPETGIENLLKDWFADSLMGQATVPTLIMSYDLFEGQPVEIKSYEERSFLVRDAARATSAAPTYFSPLIKDGRILVDGGVVANNPALYAYLEAKKLYPNCEKFHILSLSTGGKSHTMTEDETKGLLSWVEQVSPMYSTAQKCTADLVLRSMPDVNYLRIDNPLELAIKMDDTSPSAINSMEEFAKRVTESREEEFKEFAALLTKRATASTTPKHQ